MTIFKPISEKQAKGKVKKVFGEIKKTRKIKKIPNFWRSLAHNPDLIEIPCAITVHGEFPRNEITTNASPKPNNIRPKQRKNNVDNFGFRLKVSSELHETFGIFLIVRNI